MTVLAVLAAGLTFVLVQDPVAEPVMSCPDFTAMPVSAQETYLRVEIIRLNDAGFSLTQCIKENEIEAREIVLSECDSEVPFNEVLEYAARRLLIQCARKDALSLDESEWETREDFELPFPPSRKH